MRGTRSLNRGLQSTRRWTAYRKTAKVGTATRDTVRQQSNVSRPVLERRSIRCGLTAYSSGGERESLAHQHVIKLAAPPHSDGLYYSRRFQFTAARIQSA